MNTSHRPIAGLFASGDVIGLFLHNYPSCTGQTRNAVFSYLAGRGALKALFAARDAKALLQACPALIGGF